MTKRIFKSKFTALIFSLGLLSFSCSSDDDSIDSTIEPESTTTKYKVTVNFTWNESNFPTDFPSGDHFSPVIGWSHKSGSDFFKSGTNATEGIEQMAETGATGVLTSELNTKIANQEGLETTKASGATSSGTSTVDLEIEVSTNFPSVSFVSMIAPSPDWYVGAIDQNLVENGEFISSKTIEFNVYDAGTDSGENFTSANSDNNEPISRILDSPFGNGTSLSASIGTITFEKM